MSATAAAVAVSAVPNSVPFRRGHDPRRNAGTTTKAEREFKALLESEHIPKASALLANVYAAGMAGDSKMAELFFKVCGLVKKPSDDATIQALAKSLLDGMLEEARSRRGVNGSEPDYERHGQNSVK